jgi:hypothetical protein
MIRQSICFSLLLLVGCSTVRDKAYRPGVGAEKKAFSFAQLDISPDDVRQNFHELERKEVAWAGVISEIDYKQKEDAVLVAFLIKHRDFDWTDHGGKVPYRLSATGSGDFAAGWSVKMPTKISYLKTLAKPGDMIIVYGKPYRMKSGVIQIAATAVRPIPADEFQVLSPAPAPAATATE